MNGRAGATSGFLLSLAVVAMVFFLPARWLALPLLALAASLAWARPSGSRVGVVAPVLMAFLAVAVWFSGDARLAMLYPAVVNGALLAFFWSSLVAGPSAIERLARLEDPRLPPEAIGYTRFLTQVWCGIFVFNGVIAVLTAWWGDAKVWAFYNGFLAYVLIGGLVFGERLFRSRWLALYGERVVGPAVWLGPGRPDDAVVCLRGEAPVTWGRFRADIATRSAIIARSPEPLWIVSAPDAYGFAVGLLAVCLAGKEALVPQNHQEATLRDVRARHPGAPSADAVEPSATPPTAWRPRTGGRVSFYTSGSTGEPKRITRSLDALRQEADALESLFGAQLGGAQVIGAVPHHFIYGAIFRILWPLKAGRVFQAEPVPDGYAVLARVRAGGDFALVGSPSMLERLPAEEAARLAGLKAVFSSGSLLRTDVALRWSGPIEIYGSTETSGVAWRRQVIGGEGWSPFPGVDVSLTEDGRLQVASPYVARGCGITGDAARLHPDGTFELRGRVDRIAKVEGRRVSLPELEALLEAHPSVARCVLVQPDGASRLCGVLVPKPGLTELDYPALLVELRALLVARHDAVVAPRRWKFLPALPVDGRGKLDQARLRALFAPVAGAPTPEACWPQLLSHRLRDGEVEVAVQVAPDLPYFGGHFPGFPILPGVAVLSWASLFDSWFLGGTMAHRAVDNLKFTAAIQPGERIVFTLTKAPGGAVRFRCDGPGQPKASGTLLPAQSTHAA